MDKERKDFRVRRHNAQQEAYARRGIVYNLPPLAHVNPSPLEYPLQPFIGIQAWSPKYRELAVKYTVPAVVQSLLKWNPEAKATFFIHTDKRADFEPILGHHNVRFFDIGFAEGLVASRGLIQSQRTNDDNWTLFKRCHLEALAATPTGGITILLNSDILMSIETMTATQQIMHGNPAIRVIVSVGIRSLIDNNLAPVGVKAPELMRWVWNHQHGITRDCIWGKGMSLNPTVVFFEHGLNEVSMHGFHLTPMFIKKDRNLHYAGTIDDDLMNAYKDHELHYLTGSECAFAELSPAWKKHPSGRKLNDVMAIREFGRVRMAPAHIRNFKHRINILGNPQSNHPAADQIIAELNRSPVRRLGT